ncbi:hypothetical protein K439DRAFT_1610648 [Ramaria rubella]|nr:hypothetical protein K439DRAFT_1610648 [Ramaria rubella]
MRVIGGFLFVLAVIQVALAAPIYRRGDSKDVLRDLYLQNRADNAELLRRNPTVVTHGKGGISEETLAHHFAMTAETTTISSNTPSSDRPQNPAPVPKMSQALIDEDSKARRPARVTKTALIKDDEKIFKANRAKNPLIEDD